MRLGEEVSASYIQRITKQSSQVDASIRMHDFERLRLIACVAGESRSSYLYYDL